MEHTITSKQQAAFNYTVNAFNTASLATFKKVAGLTLLLESYGILTLKELPTQEQLVIREKILLAFGGNNAKGKQGQFSSSGQNYLAVCKLLLQQKRESVNSHLAQAAELASSTYKEADAGYEEYVITRAADNLADALHTEYGAYTVLYECLKKGLTVDSVVEAKRAKAKAQMPQKAINVPASAGMDAEGQEGETQAPDTVEAPSASILEQAEAIQAALESLLQCNTTPEESRIVCQLFHWIHSPAVKDAVKTHIVRMQAMGEEETGAETQAA